MLADLGKAGRAGHLGCQADEPGLKVATNGAGEPCAAGKTLHTVGNANIGIGAGKVLGTLDAR